MRALNKRMSLLVLFCMLLQVGVPLQLGAKTAYAVGDEAVNLVPNGDFETISSIKNASWVNGVQPEGWGIWLASGSGKASVSESVYQSGSHAVQIEHVDNARTGLTINVPIAGGEIYTFGARIKTDNVVSSGGVFVRTQFYKKVKGLDGSASDEKISDGPSTAKLSGTNDWTLYEAVAAAPQDAKYMRIEPFFETGKGTVWFDDISLTIRQGVTGIALQPELAVLDIGEKLTLQAVLTPENADVQSIVWSSSNPDVASVEAGVVTAHQYGTTTITAASPDGLVSAKAAVSVESAALQDGYELLVQKWKEKLLGGASLNLNDPDTAAYINSLSQRVSNEDGTGLWDQMNKSANAEYLWPNMIGQTNTDSAAISKAYSAIRDLALAYAFEGTEQFGDESLKDDVLLALEWMYNYQYNERKKIAGNWFDWEIAAPQSIMDILILMEDELSAAQLEKYIKVIDTFVPDPTKRVQNANVTETGANLLDKALVVVLRGALGKQNFKLEQGKSAMSSEYRYVQSGDGIYEDGSLIQHTNVAYTGAYGGVLIGRMADLLYLYHDSPWESADPEAANVYKWIGDSFETLIYNGAMMDMVKGRSISRETDSDHLTGRAIIRTIARLAEGAPAEQADRMKSMIKAWVQADTTFANYYENMPIYEMSLIKAIMKDESITPREELVKHQNFAAMDRVVHLRPGFGFGISMFSDRISAFEYGNGENKTGWYTGIGMTNLYNDDFTQFSNAYWPTVDMKRLSGTTTDGYLPAPKDWGAYYNGKTWVGGSVMEDQYGAAGMSFSLEKSTGSKLSGKKSWFMFDDEIVAVGSDITSTEQRKVETIVENRQLNEQGSNALTVNGQEKPASLGWTEKMDNVSWAHLAGNTADTGIGYYFPAKATITGMREARTGAWNDINTGGSAAQITRNYASLAFDHGTAPAKAGYSYVILPNKSAAAMEEYSKQPDVEVISQTSKSHAVSEKSLGITAINFWEADRVEFVRSQQAASVMVKEQGNKLTVSVSDPTQKQDKIIVDLGKAVTKELTRDDSITVLQTSPYVKLEINTKQAIGGSHTIAFEYDPSQTIELEDEESNPGETVLAYVSEDAYVNAGAKAAQNFGAVGYLNIKNGAGDYLRSTYLKYDLTELLSRADEIESVKLHVYGKVNDSRNSPVQVSAHEAGNGWTEASLNWNNKPEAGAKLDSAVFDSELGWREFDLTAYAKSSLPQNEALTVVLQGNNDLTVEVRSKENEGGIYKSYLEITMKPSIPVTGIRLSSSAVKLAVGDSERITAAAEPSEASLPNLIWTTDREDMIKLEASEQGVKLTALKAGRATVTVSTEDGKHSATVSVVVTLTSVAGDLNGDGKVSVGDLGIASALYGKTSEDSDWAEAEAADINGDGKIDREDLQWFAEQILK